MKMFSLEWCKKFAPQTYKAYFVSKAIGMVRNLKNTKKKTRIAYACTMSSYLY